MTRPSPGLWIAALLLAACRPPAGGTGAAEPTLAITGVDVVDVVGGGILGDRTILIADDRIVAVRQESAGALPSEVQVLDGRGLYAMPGLWDMHVHMLNDGTTAVGWDFHTPDSDGEDPRSIYMPVYLAFGVTGTREMSGGLVSVDLRDKIRDGVILGPHMVVGSPLLEGPRPIWPGENVIAIEGPEHAREVVTRLHDQGFDFLKPYSLLSPESYRALVERAHDLGMEVAGELPVQVSAWEAAALGQHSIEHLTGVEFAASSRESELRGRYSARLRALEADSTADDGFEVWNRSEWEPFESLDPFRLDSLFSHLASHGTWVVPTLIVQRMLSHPDDPALAANPDLRYVDPWSRDLEALRDEFDPDGRLRGLHDFRMTVIDDLHEAGVGVLAGSDTPGGFTLHQELELFVESGLTPLEALRTATIGPARFLGREAESGSIEVGRYADMVLVRGNPLDDIANAREIEAVIFQGHLLDRAHLDRILEELAFDAENWPEG